MSRRYHKVDVKSPTTYIMLVTYFLQNLENQRTLSLKPPDKGLTFPACYPLPFLHQNRTLLKLAFVLLLSFCKKTGSKITIFPLLTNLVAWLTNEMFEDAHSLWYVFKEPSNQVRQSRSLKSTRVLGLDITIIHLFIRNSSFVYVVVRIKIKYTAYSLFSFCFNLR